MTYIYCRVSSKEQAALGHSLAAQALKCIRYAEQHGMTLGPESNSGRAGVFVDAGASSLKKKSLSERAGGKALLEALRPGDNVIITTPSRIWRNLLYAETQITAWVNHSINLFCTDLSVRFDTASGRFMLQLMCAIAEWNNKIRSQRIKEGHALRRMKEAHPEQFQTESDKVRGNTRFKKDETTDEMRQALLKAYGTPTTKAVEFTGKIRAYIRVSKTEQTCGPQKQALLSTLQRDPKYKDAEIEWYEDHGVSAFKTPAKKRSGMKRLLQDVQPGDMVVALRMDRIIRSIIELDDLVLTLRQKGTYLWIMDCDIRTDNPDSDILMRVLSFVAEMESREIDKASRSGVNIAIMRGTCDQRPDGLRIMDWATEKQNIRCASLISIFPPEVQLKAWMHALELFRRGRDGWTAAIHSSNRLAEEYNLPKCSHKRWPKAMDRDNVYPDISTGSRRGTPMPELRKQIRALDREHGYSKYRQRMMEWSEVMEEAKGAYAVMFSYFGNWYRLKDRLRALDNFLVKAELTPEEAISLVMRQANPLEKTLSHVRKLRDIAVG